MRVPDCADIVSAKNLWKIAIEFISRVDYELMEYNLKLAYIVYLLCKAEGVSKKKTTYMVFMACFNDIGKHHIAKEGSSAAIETYLFLKYFSPIKDYAEITLDNYNSKKSYKGKQSLFYICRKYTTNLVEQNDKDQAFACLARPDFEEKDYKKLYKVISRNNLTYELNSAHYKTVVYTLISTMMFKGKERDELINMLSSLFEMYSIQTLYHSKITASVAYLLAKNMHISHSDRAKVYVAGLCHDLGKVQIPLEILEKAGKLTDEEYGVMKTHVIHTKEILAHNLDFDIIEIAARHHEKLDGSGYPNHIDGDHLTKCQKVLQVADIISALMGKRSYKASWSAEKTIEILNSEVDNKRLDKNVVECFIDNQNKIIKVSKKLMDEADKKYEKINRERDYLIRKNNR